MLVDRLSRYEQFCRTTKNQFIKKAKFPFEGRIATELLDTIPERSNLMISNSLPIRDTDFFATTLDKQLESLPTECWSGIDGINSTALGIAKASKRKATC